MGDCSRRTCPRSTSWTQMGDKVSGKDYICTHKIQQECADQGVCDRATGLCECFPGFTGSACQRTACPDDCSGHGTCRLTETSRMTLPLPSRTSYCRPICLPRCS